MSLTYHTVEVKEKMQPKTQTETILKLIDALGLRQKWLARKIGYTPGYFNDIIYYRNGAKLNPFKAPLLVPLLRKDLATILKLFGLPKRYLEVLGDGGLEPPTSCL